MHRIPAEPSDAVSTMAAYFRYGMEAGLLEPDSAKEWAFSVIAACDQPAIEVIEVATATRREHVLDALGAAMDGADLQKVGSMLLSHLHEQLEQRRVSLRASLRMAIQFVNATLPDSVLWYELDGIADELALAESGSWGTLEDVRSRLLRTLKPHDQ